MLIAKNLSKNKKLTKMQGGGEVTPTPAARDPLEELNAEIGTEEPILPDSGQGVWSEAALEEAIGGGGSILNPYQSIASSYMAGAGEDVRIGVSSPEMLEQLQGLENQLREGDISGLFDPSLHPIVRLQMLERAHADGALDDETFDNMRLALQDEYDMLKDIEKSSGGGASDALGWAQLAQNERLQKENLAISLLTEKLQEESVNRTGERDLTIDLLSDMMQRTTAQRLAAKDYVDTLMSVAEKAPMPGQEYYAGSEPGGARDVLREIAGIEGEFPRKIGTAEIPTGMLQPNLPTTEESLTTGRDLARKLFAEQGIGPGGEATAGFPTVETVQQMAGTAKEGKIIKAAQGTVQIDPFGEYSPEQLNSLANLQASGLVPTIGRGDSRGGTSTVVSGTEQDVLGFLRDQIASENRLKSRDIDISEALARGEFPGGAPTADMQKAQLNYQEALEVAKINAGSAQAQANAQKAAAALYAAAQKYAADQGLKGAEASAAATKYVANVQARTAAESLMFEQAKTQATLGANPRTVFESLFANRLMTPPSRVSALQGQIRTNVMTPVSLGGRPTPRAKEGAKVVEGPSVVLVGDRKDGDKDWDTSEYALLQPGSVVAKKRRGEKPTVRNAVRALMGQVEEMQGGGGVGGYEYPNWVKPFEGTAEDYKKKAGGYDLLGWTGQVAQPTPVASSQTGGTPAVNLITQARNSPFIQARIQAFMRAASGAGGSGSLGRLEMMKRQKEKYWHRPRPVRPGQEPEGMATGGGVAPPNTAPPSWMLNPTEDIPEDFLPRELLNSPALGGTATSSLIKPSPIRGAFGETKEQLGQRFNPLATSYYNLGKRSGTELEAFSGLLSLLGIEPQDYFEASRRATASTLGTAMNSTAPFVARRFAGSLLG